MAFRSKAWTASLLLVVVALATAIVVARSTLSWLHSPIAALTESQSYEIPKGTSFAALAREGNQVNVARVWRQKLAQYQP